jgi:hypothetical protein
VLGATGDGVGGVTLGATVPGLPVEDGILGIGSFSRNSSNEFCQFQ